LSGEGFFSAPFLAKHDFFIYPGSASPFVHYVVVRVQLWDFFPTDVERYISDFFF